MRIIIRMLGATNTLLIAAGRDVLLEQSYPSRRALLLALRALEEPWGE